MPHCGQSPHSGRHRQAAARAHPNRVRARALLKPLCLHSLRLSSPSSATSPSTTSSPVARPFTQRTRRDPLPHPLTPRRSYRPSPEPIRSVWPLPGSRPPPCQRLRRPGRLPPHRRRALPRPGSRRPPCQRLRWPGRRPPCQRLRRPGWRPPHRRRALRLPWSRRPLRGRQPHRTGRLRAPQRRRAPPVPRPTPRCTLALRCGLPQPALCVCRVRPL